MTKSELVVRLSSHFPKLVTQDTEAVVKVIIDALANTLADAKRAELRGFGSFKVTSVALVREEIRGRVNWFRYQANPFLTSDPARNCGSG